MNLWELTAPCHFGTEAVLKREILDLGYEVIRVEDGRVTFEADAQGVADANLFLRTTERVLLKVGEVKAETFDELFEKTKALPWENYIPKNGKFWVAKANSIKSKLFSPSDIQSIMKKAIVERLKGIYGISWFPEDGPEFPILDGSAQYYVNEIERVGTVEQSAVKDFYIIKSKIEFRDDATGSSIIVLPDENFSLNVLVSYDSTIIPNQFATLEDMAKFKDEVAASRTFVFVREIEPLLQAGLIKGGDLDNAIVIYEREMPQDAYDKLADVMGVPHMDAKQLGYINHKPLVWPNECARHKLLDVIGDLALIGKPIKGRIIATRPGHTINNKFARQMRKEIRLHEIQAPTYDCNREPIMDVNRIRELLPHRYPFQLVDKVIEIGANYIVGVKNVTANEPFFQGHFPQEPVMPGVLQVEAMAQTGGLLVLNSVDEPERYSTYFMKIDGVKFRQKVVPGDTLIFRVELLAPIRRGISTMKGYVFVGEKVVCEAEFMAQIVKNK